MRHFEDICKLLNTSSPMQEHLEMKVINAILLEEYHLDYYQPGKGNIKL